MDTLPDHELMVGRLTSEIARHYDLRCMKRPMCSCGWISPRDINVTWSEHLAAILALRKPWLSK